MNKLNQAEVTELSHSELIDFQGGQGPLLDALEWYYKTMGSFYKGVWDGLTGQPPAV